jgi:hypothetical protein
MYAFLPALQNLKMPLRMKSVPAPRKKMEETSFSESLVKICDTIQRPNPENHSLNYVQMSHKARVSICNLNYVLISEEFARIVFNPPLHNSLNLLPLTVNSKEMSVNVWNAATETEIQAESC